MIQDLWTLQIQEQERENKIASDVAEALAIPSLVKPRATSFLTGKEEAVLRGQQEASDWQLEIPQKIEFDFACKVSHFAESFCREGSNFDLMPFLVDCNRLDLIAYMAGKPTKGNSNIAPRCRPIVEALLECVSDLQAVRGYYCSTSGRKMLVLERQNQFVSFFLGTESEQQGNVGRQSEKKLALKGDVVRHHATVYEDRYEAFRELEMPLFKMLDQLAEDNPFCDFIFCGHGFGAGMGLLAAYRYALAHPELRCAAHLTATPKVGLDDFRLSVHSLPNLKVMSLECGHMPCSVGHCIRMTPRQPVKAYKFGDGPEAPSLGVRSRLFKRDKNVADYVRALQELDDSGQSWVTSYFRQDGTGVRGEDDEGGGAAHHLRKDLFQVRFLGGFVYVLRVFVRQPLLLGVVHHLTQGSHVLSGIWQGRLPLTLGLRLLAIRFCLCCHLVILAC